MKRAAIIGCGTIFQVHLPIIVANPEIELCAVCDNNPAVQEKLPAAAKAVPSAVFILQKNFSFPAVLTKGRKNGIIRA